MGRWTAIASAGVRHEDIRALLTDAATSWEKALHVTATTSLAASMRRTGRVALPIATLLDLIVLPGHPDRYALSIEGFPGQASLDDDNVSYNLARKEWQAVASGRRLRVALEMDASLRRSVSEGRIDRPRGRVLINDRREFTRSVAALAAAGVEPTDLQCSDPVAQSAVRAWKQMERDVPAMTTLRSTLWIDSQELAEGRTANSRGVGRRIRTAFDQAFYPEEDDAARVVVYHGFYFFTPAQWALFQLIREIEGIDQIFVVHDDNENPAFKTWRLFFSEHDWRMPSIGSSRTLSSVTAPAAALRDAMKGRTVDSASLGTSLRLLECRNPAEFVRDWRIARSSAVDDEGPMYYASDAGSVQRFVQRLDRDVASSPVDLAQLPVGTFLLSLHDCIDTSGDTPEVRLTGPALLDMAGSGHLAVDGAESPEAMSALRRALPFFKNCTDSQTWRVAAQSLVDNITGPVVRLGVRESDETDVTRIRAAVGNPLRLVPWTDLTVEDARRVQRVVNCTLELVEETAAQEEVRIEEHLVSLRSRLERGMRGMDDAERNRILAKFRGLGDVSDTRIDVEGLVDIVRMLLGRQVEDDAEGQPVESEDGILEVRALDALGFERVRRDIHVTNLSDGNFPAQAQFVGWPFRAADLRWHGCHAEPIALEILEARSLHAGQSDLYLLWLALDAVESGTGRLTLSWIADIGGEARNPSSLLTLLMAPDGLPAPVAAAIGGMRVQHVDMSAVGLNEPRGRPDVMGDEVTSADLQAAVLTIDPKAAATAQACARRFALQWALGDSAAYPASHHQAMLFGNVIGALQKNYGFSANDAEEAANSIWRTLTQGERSSSEYKRTVHPGHGASAAWLLTLAGRRQSDPVGIDAAYAAARDEWLPDAGLLVPVDSGLLPPPVDDSEICRHCPVRDRCAGATYESP
jgi:hypothetical protein